MFAIDLAIPKYIGMPVVSGMIWFELNIGNLRNFRNTNENFS